MIAIFWSTAAIICRRTAECRAPVPGPAGVVVDEVLPRMLDRLAGLGQERFAVGRLTIGGAPLEAAAGEQRGAREAGAAASRARREGVGRGERHHISAFLTPEGPSA